MSSYVSNYSYPSPPGKPNVSSQYSRTLNEMAPAMPYVPLPCDDPRDEFLIPTPIPPPVHPALSVRSTVVQYDFSKLPQTVKMSPLSPQPFFPSQEPASNPSTAILYVHCELTGHVISIQKSTGVTCGDVLDQIYTFFNRTISSGEWRSVQGSQRDAMKFAYTRRTGRVYDRNAQMKAVDYLLGHSVFKCLVPIESNASESRWLLQTIY